MNINSAIQNRPMTASAASAAPRATAPQAATQQAAGDQVTLGQSQPQPPVQPAQGQGQQPQPPAQQLPMKDWTVLVYSVSDNNLYSFMQTDLDEAERVGSTDQMNLLAETSHQPKGGSVVRMKLETDNTPGLKSPVLQDLGKKYDMAKSDSLADSIAWAMKEYPSKHTMVILSDHGGGWQGANQSASNNSWMNVSDLEDGFKKAQDLTGKKVDVIGFDECLMASTEVVHQLKDAASYLVGSEETEGGAGWQYDETFPKNKESNGNSRVLTGKMLNFAAATMAARDGLEPIDMAKGIVRMAEGHQRDLGTMSAIDTSKVGAVISAVDQFAGAVIDANVSKADFGKVINNTQKFYEFADMGHMAELAGKQFGGDIAKAADAIKAAMSEAVVAEQHSSRYPNAKGLNIEFNKQYSATDVNNGENVPNMSREDKDRIAFAPYGSLKFAQDTRWDEMLKKVR